MIELTERLAGTKKAYWVLKIMGGSQPIVHTSKDERYIRVIKREYETGVRAIPGQPTTVNFGR